MDVRLAEGNGVEAASAIYTHLGIFRCSLRAMSRNRYSAGNAALGCLQKPYDQRSLVRSIQIVEQVMNGLEPTLPLPRNLKLYEREIIAMNRRPEITFQILNNVSSDLAQVANVKRLGRNAEVSPVWFP